MKVITVLELLMIPATFIIFEMRYIEKQTNKQTEKPFSDCSVSEFFSVSI